MHLVLCVFRRSFFCVIGSDPCRPIRAFIRISVISVRLTLHASKCISTHALYYSKLIRLCASFVLIEVVYITSFFLRDRQHAIGYMLVIPLTINISYIQSKYLNTWLIGISYRITATIQVYEVIKLNLYSIVTPSRSVG